VWTRFTTIRLGASGRLTLYRASSPTGSRR
jgi:hypothetical protein